MHLIRTGDRTRCLARLAFVTQLVLSVSLFACTSTGSPNVTDAQGRANIQLPATHLNPNICPDPEVIKLRDSNGNRIEVDRVLKQADGSCRAIAK